jgi:hypothetical protein
VSCGFSRGLLALWVGGDLSDAEAAAAACHVRACDDCRQLVGELRANQSALRTLGCDLIGPSDCVAMRREVMAIIEDQRDAPGWAVRLERAMVLALRPRPYAVAAGALLAVLSVSLMAQMRYTDHGQPPVLDATDTLIRPVGYRTWVLVGRSTGEPASRSKIYVDPSSYREFARTGQFPEGTLMVWEADVPAAEASGQPHGNSPLLLASLKDRTRFEGGWGYFDFTGSNGAIAAKARALPDSTGCRVCHEQGVRFLAYRG